MEWDERYAMRSTLLYMAEILSEQTADIGGIVALIDAFDALKMEDYIDQCGNLTHKQLQR